MDICLFSFAVKELSTYISSNKIFPVFNDTPRRDSNCPDFSQGLWGMGFQGIPNVFGHAYEQSGCKSNFNSQIIQNTVTARKRIIDKYMQKTVTRESCWHRGIINIIVSLSSKSSVLCLFILHSPQSLITNDLFIVSIVLPLPECHIVAIMHYVAFWDWLNLPFNRKHYITPFTLSMCNLTLYVLLAQEKKKSKTPAYCMHLKHST